MAGWRLAQISFYHPNKPFFFHSLLYPFIHLEPFLIRIHIRACKVHQWVGPGVWAASVPSFS